MNTELEAMKLVLKMSAELMDATGMPWSTKVWFLVGWHCSVTCGRYTVRPTKRGDGFYTVVSDGYGNPDTLKSTCASTPLESLMLAANNVLEYSEQLLPTVQMAVALDELDRSNKGETHDSTN